MEKEADSAHLERFDPRGRAGSLIDSEHRARYHWASRAVAGKAVLDAACGVGYGIEILAKAGAQTVTGVDLDPKAVAEASRRFGEHATQIVEGDLRSLPFEDDSFDVVACFEALEHLEEASPALSELRRVLRADGVLILSCPNPDSYPPGNEFHQHELRPDELAATVGEHFAQLASYRQDAWLASMIEPATGAATQPALQPTSQEVLLTGAKPENPDYSLIVAGAGDLPEMPAIVACGGTFDVQWWSDQLANSKRETAQALEREEAAVKHARDVATALLDANQELARIPVLRHRLETLEELHDQLSQRYHEVLGSTSWRITAPLRRARSRKG